MNIEKFLYTRVRLWILLLVIIFFIIFSILFGNLVLRSENAKKIALIPDNLKLIFSDNKDPGIKIHTKRFENISGFKIHDKKFNYINNQYLLLSRFSGSKRKSIVELIDIKNHTLIHTWDPNINEINKNSNISKEIVNFERDHNKNRYQIYHPYLDKSGNLYFKSWHYTPIVKIDICSNYLSSIDLLTHHSIETDGDGLWTPITSIPSKNNPNLDTKQKNEVKFFYDDGLLKIDWNNNIVFKKSLIEIFLENNLSHLIFSGKEPDYDPIHLNDIQPVMKNHEYFKKGDLFLSLRNMSMIVLYRPSNNKIIWYKQFPWIMQHDVDVVGENLISIYNNNRLLNNFNKKIKNNEILIYDFKKDKYYSHLNESFKKEEIKTVGEGLSEILADGSTFVEETEQGRLIYFDKNGNKIWEYVNRSKHNNEIYRLNWSRIVDLDINEFKKRLNEAHNCRSKK